MTMPFGSNATMYILTDGKITAHITNFGATIHRLYVPDADGKLDDVVLGFDSQQEYVKSTTFFGTVVGRGANRTKCGKFTLNGKQFQLGINDGNNNLHCGPDYYKDRIWTVETVSENSIIMRLDSPDGDQGFPGNAVIRVTYTLENGALHIIYDADRTTYSYFALFKNSILLPK